MLALYTEVCVGYSLRFHPESAYILFRIHCPNSTAGGKEVEVAAISILAILNKVKVEAFMWVSANSRWV